MTYMDLDSRCINDIADAVLDKSRGTGELQTQIKREKEKEKLSKRAHA